jgi:hypothetical protein
MLVKFKNFPRAALLLALVMLYACSGIQSDPSSGSRYEDLKAYADEIKVINTHEHQRWSEENAVMHQKLSHLIQSSYLGADVVSAGGSWIGNEQLDSMSIQDYWDINGEALDLCRNTTYYSHFLAGFQILYDFKDPYFTASNVAALSETVEKNYSDHRSWFHRAFEKAGFELMFLDQYWNQLNTEIDQDHYALVFNINSLVSAASQKPALDLNGPELFQLAAREGFSMQTLDEYLSFCDFLFQQNLKKGVVCLKNSMAYSRSICYEKVRKEVAAGLYVLPSSQLSPEEAKMIEDYMFHWIIEKSVEYKLPIQIHTGYLAGNGNTLENSNPLKLNQLFLDYPEARFVLFHGGFPWTGEYGAMGKMFPNVYLDLVWLPQISRERAVSALDEMLDLVPYNKFFWGGDCAFIEESTGSLEFGRSVVAEVLDRRISRGLLTEALARQIMDGIFRENAIRFFALEERLGLSQ